MKFTDGGSVYVNNYLKELGKAPLSKTPIWSSQALVEAPDAVVEVHKEFIDAGSDIISTFTYQLRQIGFNTEEEYENAVESSIALALRACELKGKSTEVLLSFGSYASTFPNYAEYNYSYSQEELEPMKQYWIQRFKTFGKVLEKLRVELDYVAFQTLPDIQEFKVIYGILKEWSTLVGYPRLAKKYVVSYSCKDESTVDQAVTNLVKTEEFLSKMESDSGEMWTTGYNCFPIHLFNELVTKQMSRHNTSFKGGYVYQPNNFVPEKMEKPDDQKWANLFNETKNQIKFENVLYGGCCFVSPNSIAKLTSC